MSKPTDNLSYTWLEEHANETPLLKTALAFDGTSTTVEEFHKFIATESDEWQKAEKNKENEKSRARRN